LDKKEVEGIEKLVMNRECEKRDAFGMSIGSPDFIQERRDGVTH